MIKLLTYLCLIGYALIISGCENNPVKHQKAPLSLAKTIEGGCNLQEKKFMTGEQTDTAIFTISDDTINVFVGINYACCTPFVSDAVFRNDSLIIEVNDICSALDECYCKCLCYYTWDFKLTGFETTEYPYKITLDGLLARSHPECIEEGTLTITSTTLLVD